MFLRRWSPPPPPPRQWHGRWRDYGPWTDLYAFGCLAWRLATGRLPYEGDTLVKMARAHLHHPPPPFRPRCAVPEGFDAWLATNVKPQRQEGYSVVTLNLPLGDITADQERAQIIVDGGDDRAWSLREGGAADTVQFGFGCFDLNDNEPDIVGLCQDDPDIADCRVGHLRQFSILE